MKRNIFIKLLTLIIFLMASMVSFAQNPLEITMKIDFGLWERGDSTTFYNAITFSDNFNENGNTNPDNGKRGRSFRSRVRRNLKLEWKSEPVNVLGGSDFDRIVLISVMRNPEPGIGGNELFDSPWYNSEDSGVLIEGRIKNEDIQEYESERYVISFAVRYDDGYYDIYTVDPIIRGSDN